MRNSLLPPIGPISTPFVIKTLIASTASISILISIIQTFFDQFGLFPGPEIVFSLNWWGLNHAYLWQPITYLFIQESPLSFTSLIFLLVNMYALWVIGTDLVELKGKGAFLRFYFFTGILTGLATLILMPSPTLFKMIAGPEATLLAMLVVWAMAFPESELLLFFLIPAKAKWLVAGLVASILLVNLTEWNLSHFLLYLSALLFGYGYVAICWGWRSPFAFTTKMDRYLSNFGINIQKWFLKNKQGKHTNLEKFKIIDMHTGQPLSEDEAFIELMLSKISKHGENALSWGEKKRMQQISDKKKNKNL